MSENPILPPQQAQDNAALPSEVQKRTGPPVGKTTFERTHFATSRLMEFFSEKELTIQTGQPKRLWPISLTRELIDNALDACENVGTPPAIHVIVEPDSLSVVDNGPGLPAKVIELSIDYSVRVSDKANYVSTSRGQLGIGLKFAWAAPFVVDGERGQVEVMTGGTKHTIQVTLDQLAQEPQLHHELCEDNTVKTGTFIKVHWPRIASFLDGREVSDFYHASRLLRAYATFNPHAHIELVTANGNLDLLPSIPSWKKWSPQRPTNPRWYTAERFGILIAALITEERRGGKSITVRDFVRSFDGLTSTKKAKGVVAAAGLENAWLHDLVRNDAIDAQAVQRLLEALQRATRPVNYKTLGVIGEEHLSSCLVKYWGCTEKSVRYKKAVGYIGNLSFVLEVAFGVHSDRVDNDFRQVIAGVNWSPAIQCPFSRLPYELGEMRIDEDDPVTVIVHLAYPRPEFTDRGKATISLPFDIMIALGKCIKLVGSPWKQEKSRANGKDRLNDQQLEKMRKAKQPKKLSLKEAASQVMEAAYLHASGNKADPANARQVMYSARSRVLSLTGGKCWSKSSYFTQVLLPAFVEANPELTSDWNFVFDARGRLIEPHTGECVDLGTLEVRNYIRNWTSTCPDQLSMIAIANSCPTYGPTNRYRYALFVEKEGFSPLLERHRIADRYDIAIMSTKGMSVTAARELVDMLSQAGVTVLVLRDFDKSGFSIVHTLRTNTRRYKFQCPPKVIDIGLRLEDVRQWGLEELAEPVAYRNAKKDPREMLRAAGATEEECAFLVNSHSNRGWSGSRAEINAFTSPRLIEFLEYKFEKVGVKKVVPSGDSLKRAYHRAWLTAQIQESIDVLRNEVSKMNPPAMPDDLHKQIAQAVQGTNQSWDDALADIVRAMGIRMKNAG